MVKLLMGHMGAGKTKGMIALANEKVDSKKGDIVFINRNDRLNFDLKHDIRVISMLDYPQIANADNYIGFLHGLMSGNSDIETIFIDSILKHADINLENVHQFLNKLLELSKEREVEIVLSLSAEREELPNVSFEDFEIIA